MVMTLEWSRCLRCFRAGDIFTMATDQQPWVLTYVSDIDYWLTWYNSLMLVSLLEKLYYIMLSSFLFILDSNNITHWLYIQNRNKNIEMCIKLSIIWKQHTGAQILISKFFFIMDSMLLFCQSTKLFNLQDKKMMMRVQCTACSKSLLADLATKRYFPWSFFVGTCHQCRLHNEEKTDNCLCLKPCVLLGAEIHRCGTVVKNRVYRYRCPCVDCPVLQSDPPPSGCSWGAMGRWGWAAPKESQYSGQSLPSAVYMWEHGPPQGP